MQCRHVPLRNTNLEIQVRGQWDLQGDITILAMMSWSLPSGGDARETTMASMEGGRGNRGKARLSSEHGISRRYRAKPYVPQIRWAHFNNSHLTQLSQLFHPKRKILRVIRKSILEIVPALQVGLRKKEKNAFDFVTYPANISLFLFVFATTLDSPNWETRAEFCSRCGFTRPHKLVNRSRETRLLTDFGNHFIAHSLLARNWMRPNVIQCIFVCHWTSYYLGTITSR